MKIQEVKSKEENNEENTQTGSIEVTIQAKSSVFKNGEYTGTNYHFHVRDFSGRVEWYEGSIVLKIKPENLDLAAMEVERIHREGLYHMFGECKKRA